MRLTVAAALLTLSAVPSRAAYLVDFGSGDRMTVDSYWEEGDRVHLMRDGVELTVPRSRIRHLQQQEGGDSPPAVRRAQPAPSKSQAPRRQESREELEARQRHVERHLLRVQQERFEAQNRGEPTERLGREFRHAQEKRRAVVQELERRAR